jgi:hypothetical protein
VSAPKARATATRDELVRLAGKLRLIPESARTYAVAADRAWDDYQLPPDLLRELRKQGMPAQRAAGGWRYDETDLLNAALHLDIGSRHRKVLAWWIRELARPHGDTSCYRMDYVLGCPEPGHSGPCRYSLLDPGGRRAEVVRTDPAESAAHSVRFRLNRRWPPLPEPLRGLIDEIAAIRFLRLPYPLHRDTGFIQATGVGDCCGVAMLTVSRARAGGMTARLCFGRSLTPPFSSAHHWAEVLVEDVWTPVDPVLIEALLDWGICAPHAWTRYDSLGGVLGRMSGRWQPIALHNGEQTEVRLPTWRIPQ